MAANWSRRSHSHDHTSRPCHCADDRIVYGTGQVVASAEIEAEAEKNFALTEVSYVHIRPAQNNCYACRIERG